MRPHLEQRSDEELVRAHWAGESDAFGLLVERHMGVVYLIAFSVLRDREVAEDLVQEAVLRAMISIKRLDQPRHFCAWWTQIARNLAIDWLRRGQRHSRLVPLVPIDEIALRISDSETMGARETMEANQRSIALNAALWELDPQQREVVLLHFAEDLSQAEIADRLGVHRSTVSRQIKQALVAMRGTLEPTLRESARPLRIRRTAEARTMALVASALALSPAAKAALASASGIGAITAIGKPGVLASIKAALAAGGKAMATGKGLAVTLGVAAIIAGTGYHLTQGQNPRSSYSPEPGRPATVNAPVSDASNLLVNGDFSQVMNGQPVGWTQGNQVPGVQYVVAPQMGDPAPCVGFNKTVERYFPIAEWTQAISHDGSARRLRLSADVRAQQAFKAILDASFEGPTIGWTHEWAAYIGAENAGDPPANHEWTEYSGIVDIPEGTQTIHINLQMYGPGQIAFDNVRAEFVD